MPPIIAGLCEEGGPVLVAEPPNRVDFSNSTGAALHCATRGRPDPAIVWMGGEGGQEHLPVGDVPGLRKVGFTLVYLNTYNEH